jgi:ribosome-interacting GTPase 1
MLGYATTSIQLVEIPAIDSEYYDKGLVYTSDTALLIADKFEDIAKLKKEIRTEGKIIIVFNKIDLLSDQEKRKIRSKLQSKKYNFAMISSKTKEGLGELKEKLFQSFNKLRVYTKEPGKNADKKRPMILSPGSTVKDVSEKILKGFSTKVKQIKIWGPSSKFGGQIVGQNHEVKDLDIVEFKTK